MSSGIFLGTVRPKSKKAVKEAVLAAAPRTVYVEGTSLFGNDYSGWVEDAPDGRIDFVGPDPYSKRIFYGSITVLDGVAKVA